MSSWHPYRRFMPLLDERNRALVVEVKLENDDGKLALVSVGFGKERKDHLTTVRSLFEDKHDAWCAARRMSAKRRGNLRVIPPGGGSPKTGKVLARSKEIRQATANTVAVGSEAKEGAHHALRMEE